MSKKVGIILVNYKDYAQRFLNDCRDSLRAQNYSDYQIYIVDNASSLESKKYLQDNYAEAKIIENINNDGFAKGNNDGIKIALLDGCEYIFLLNMDTVIAPDALAEMVKAAEVEEKIGAVQARLMLFDDKNKINSLGNATHFLGFGYSLGYQKEWMETNRGNATFCVPGGKNAKCCVPTRNKIMYPSGAAVLFKKAALQEVGLLDEEYWMYNEDQELGWRLWLAGWKCVLAADAVVYHKYEFSRSISKYYWMDRNRILAIMECYQISTLILIAPAFIFMELGLILFSIKNGSLKEKIKVWQYFLSAKNWQYIKIARARNQKLRKVKDKEIAKLITGKVWYQEIGDWKLRLINPIFNAYWALVRATLTFL